MDREKNLVARDREYSQKQGVEVQLETGKPGIEKPQGRGVRPETRAASRHAPPPLDGQWPHDPQANGAGPDEYTF